jgi:hypothetical protein
LEAAGDVGTCPVVDVAVGVVVVGVGADLVDEVGVGRVVGGGGGAAAGEVAEGVVLVGRGRCPVRGEGREPAEGVVGELLGLGWRDAILNLAILEMAVLEILDGFAAKGGVDRSEEAAIRIVAERRDGAVAEGFLGDEVTLEGPAQAAYLCASTRSPVTCSLRFALPCWPAACSRRRTVPTPPPLRS